MNIRKAFQSFGNSAPKLVVAALPVWLGLTPIQALAQDAVGGSSTNGNVNMPPNMWTTLRTVTFDNGNTTRYCMVVGSADIQHPAGNGVTTYLFTLTDNDPQPPLNDGDERTVEFRDQPAGGVIVQDNRIKEVTTTEAFPTGPGVHVMYWLGRPAPGSPATLELDSSQTVVCTKESLAPIIDSHPEPTPD